MSRIHRSRILFSSQLHDIKWLFCKFEMSKSYVDSKISNIHDFRFFKLSKNKIILYAKTANISNVLTIVDVFEKMIISHAHSAIISRILIVVEVSENKIILYENFAIISTTILLHESICFDFYTIFIFIFDNFLCFCYNDSWTVCDWINIDWLTI